MNESFSDYIAYVDESGDHSLESIDPEYPIFVLAFCVFHKNEYINNISTAIKKFKFNHFGHDVVVLHEHDIRKAKKEFVMLINEKKRLHFMTDLNQLMVDSSFTVIAMAINKKLLKEKYTTPFNPYHLALTFGLERLYSFLREKQQFELKTHIIFESRGNKEDKDLELEFRRVCDELNSPFEIILADKKTNFCGLQLADLIARPIGRHVLNPNQENRAYQIIETKLYQNKNGKKSGIGLKCFP